MSKRWLTVFLTAFAILMLTGCNADRKAVTETTDGFLSAIVANDKNAASQYASEEFMKSDVMRQMEPEYLADSFYAAMNISKEDLSEEAKAAVDSYVAETIERAYKSYEIQDVKIEKDTASVTAKIELGYDPAASSGITEETKKLLDEYQAEHYDELINIYVEEGEKALYKKMYSDMIPIIIGKMHEQLEKSGVSEEKTILTLTKVDGKWLVTSLEENRPSAAQAVSAQEAAAAENAAADNTAAEQASEGSTGAEYAGEGSTQAEYAGEGSTQAEYASSGSTAETAAEE